MTPTTQTQRPSPAVRVFGAIGRQWCTCKPGACFSHCAYCFQEDGRMPSCPTFNLADPPRSKRGA